MKAICLIVCAFPLFGQSLEVIGEAGQPGKQVSVNIVLASPSGKEPTALQWETTFLASQLTLQGTAPLIGYAAHTAGKSIHCAASQEPKSGIHAYRCILAEGNKGIANGPVAMLTFQISPNAEHGKLRIRVEHAMAVSKELAKTDIKDAEGVVTVQR